MNEMERRVKRNTKITRTLIRLKHSLAADDEIEQELERQRQMLTEGQVPAIEMKLSEFGE